jgi:hypothetical protein
MLEQMRRQGASIFIYLIFILLIVIFVYGLAPSSRGGNEGGCRSSSNTAVVVDGHDANQTSYLVAYSANNATGRQKTYAALEWLIRRELLAQGAAAMGIHTTGELTDDAFKHGWFFLGGERIDFSHQFLSEVDGERFFSYKGLKDWASRLNVSVGAYREEQTRGMQAAMMAEILRHSVRVSRDEALADYLYENNTVTYDVVAFDPAAYRAAMKLGEADIKRYLDGHTAEVEARYKTDERLYKAVKPQLALREIFIPKAYPQAAKPADKKPADKSAKPDDKKPADDKSAKADDKKPADKKPADKKLAAGDANPRGLLPEVARAKLEAVRADIAAGKLKFAAAETQLAADSSDDSPRDNGDRGWRTAETAGLEDPAINDAVKKLKAGEMTPVIVTERGAYLLIATDKREGDLSFDQVKLDLAKTLAEDTWSKEAAKRAALAALGQAQGGKNLDQLFDRELIKQQPGSFEELLNNPDMTPEQRQQIQQLLEKQRQLRDKHGSREVHEQDVPVGWFADADGPSGSSTPATPGSAAPAAPAAGTDKRSPAAPVPAAAAPAPGAGTPAAGAAGSGTGSAAASATPATPAAPAPMIEASKDVLPPFGDVPKAKLNRLGPSPRETKMPGVGGSKAAIDALFEELAPGAVAKTVYEGEGGAYVVLQLINRAQPKVEEFDKIADAEVLRMQDARGKAALGSWLKDRCETLAKAGKIKPALDRIRETDDKGNPAPTVYHPCMYFDLINR